MAVFSFFLFVVYGFFGAVLAIFRIDVVKDGKLHCFILLKKIAIILYF